MGERLRNVAYSAKHYIAFNQTAAKLGHWRPHYLLHDVGKMIALFFIKKQNYKDFHTKVSLHHVENIWGKMDRYAMVIDWECARITKPDKPRNAFQTLHEIYPQIKSEITPVLIDLGINRPLILQ